MESVASRLRETGQHIRRQGDAFVVRTRQAGAAFLDEAYDAGRQLVGSMQTEAKRWKRFAAQRSAQARSGVKATLSVPAAEAALLRQVDGTLRAIDARVRARLARIEGGGKARANRPARKGTKAQGRGRKVKQVLPALAA